MLPVVPGSTVSELGMTVWPLPPLVSFVLPEPMWPALAAIAAVARPIVSAEAARMVFNMIFSFFLAKGRRVATWANCSGRPWFRQNAHLRRPVPVRPFGVRVFVAGSKDHRKICLEDVAR